MFTKRKDRKDKDKMPNSDDEARSKPGVIQTLGGYFHHQRIVSHVSPLLAVKQCFQNTSKPVTVHPSDANFKACSLRRAGLGARGVRPGQRGVLEIKGQIPKEAGSF